MNKVYNVNLSANKIYKVTIFKNMSGRWGIKHPSYRIHHKDFASLAYAKQWCKRQDWQYEVKQI
jgi:hypothetical protein